MNQASKDYQEKRDYIRMQINTPVSVMVRDNESVFEGTCIDLSGGGMRIEIPSALPTGTVVEVTLASNHGHNPMLCAKAMVQRVEAQPDKNSKPCVIGLSIIEVMD